jgi:predicted small secreted protein
VFKITTKLSLFFLSSLVLTGCNTVNTGSSVVKNTGKAAISSGKIVYKTGKATGRVALKVGKTSSATFNKATSSDILQNVTGAPTAKNIDRVGDKDSFGEVILSPLGDINLRKQRVPKILLTLETPYDVVRNRSCRSLRNDILKWNAVLGPDFDAEKNDDSKTRETSLDVAEAGVGTLIPFRGLVRAATGATKHENMIRREYRKGVARRAYLRGIAATRRCTIY